MPPGLIRPRRQGTRQGCNRAEIGPTQRLTGVRRRLLAVVLEHQIAGRADLRTILLQARQNGEIALVDNRAAETLHVAGTRLLLVRRSAALLLSEGIRRNRDRQHGERQEKFTKRIL